VGKESGKRSEDQQTIVSWS